MEHSSPKTEILGDFVMQWKSVSQALLGKCSKHAGCNGKGKALDIKQARATLTTNSNPCPTQSVVCVCVCFSGILKRKSGDHIPKNICLTLATR